jgi:CheY-like chemotaxis protein
VSLRILVVEDDRDARASLLALLGLLGHEVDGCGTVESSRGKLSALAFDVVLIDFTLPDGDGTEVARAATELEPRPHVIGLTGWSPARLRPADRDAFDRVVQKPLGTEQLVALLQELSESPPAP